MAKQVIMVMGVQRSGTTALFQSLASDKSVTAYDESVDSAVYHRYRLRPLPETKTLFDAAPHAVLLKPLSETFYRTLADVAEEYSEYELRVVWTYRDPVNVLYSMHRQGWLPLSELAGAMHLDPWNQRNRLALQFARSHPGQIAIVRYEDWLIDAHVFGRLTRWLGLKSKPLFRKDSSSGRRNIPAPVQQSVDAAIAETLLSLDQDRTFKPRFLSRIRHAAVHRLSLAGRGRSAGAAGPFPGNSSAGRGPRASGEMLPLSGLSGLEFWLDGSALPSDAGETALSRADRGLRRMTAAKVQNGPFVLACLHGRRALAFQPEKVVARRAAAPGVLVFGAAVDWTFLLDGRPFSIVALFKPDLPNYPPFNQREAVLLRVAPIDQTLPTFSLGWDGELDASVATLKLNHAHGEAEVAPVTISIAGARKSHRHQEWRIVHVQYRGAGGAGVLSVQTDSSAASEVRAERTRGGAPQTCELRLGGDPAKPESLFYGAVAEVAVFSRSLDAKEQDGITRYLVDKYDL